MSQRKFLPRDYLWDLTDSTKMTEKYKIDKNLQSLQWVSLDVLKNIFIQYRFFTHFYIADLSILINKLPFNPLKSILAEILHEELGEGDAQRSHPQLYDEFLLSLGVSKAALNQVDDQCQQNLQQIQQSLQNNNWAYGVGLRGMGGECLCQIYLSSMYDFFSQNPVIMERKEYLEWEFWNIHLGEVDLHHQKIVRKAIDDLLVADPELTQPLIDGYLESKTAWELFWNQVFIAAHRNFSKRLERTITLPLGSFVE